MARVVKDADVRRKELLDTALGLFETVGYERTSVEQVTERVGVAKGTFYHYFNSKQDMLHELVADWADELFDRLEREIEVMDADAVTRLRAVFVLGSSWKLEHRDTSMAYARTLYTEENLRLRHALWSGWLTRTTALLAPIVAGGAQEGTFEVSDPEATAAVLASLWFGWSDGQADQMLAAVEAPELIPEVIRGLSAVEAAMERILGLPEGRLGLRLDRFLTALADRTDAADAR